MGWSCTMAAANTLEKVWALLREHCQDAAGMCAGSGNAWDFQGKTYFMETGREHDDGRITGTVHEMYNEDGKEYARPAGRVLIAASGKLMRWPHIPKKVREQAGTEDCQSDPFKGFGNLMFK